MPRPKGSKNKPKTEAKKAPTTKKPAMKKAKAQPETKVNVTTEQVVEAPVVKVKTKAAAGKNSGEAIIRPVDDDDNTGEENTIVMQGGKATLRKSSSNPDLD